MKITRFFLLGLLIIASSCKVYKRDLILQFDDDFTRDQLQQTVYNVTENYEIEVGDKLFMDLFSNEGERLIDPSPDVSGAASLGQSGRIEYLVMQDGTVKFPIIGLISMVDLTMREAEELLEEAYNEFYNNSFVRLETSNRRVIALGSFGGGQNGNQGGAGQGGGLAQGVGGSTTGQVIELAEENMTIMEVIALAGGITIGSNASSIKLIRGELNNPQVFEIDLSTISGMTQTAMIVENGDILYLEPWRRPFRQSLAEIAPWMSVVSSVIAATLLIQNIGN